MFFEKFDNLSKDTIKMVKNILVFVYLYKKVGNMNLSKKND